MPSVSWGSEAEWVWATRGKVGFCSTGQTSIMTGRKAEHIGMGESSG